MTEVGINGAFYAALAEDDNGAVLVRADPGIQKLNIPPSVTIDGKTRVVKEVKTAAVGNHENLIEVVIPATVKRLGNGAFMLGKKLKKVTFAAAGELEIIGDGAFFECKELLAVDIPASVRRLQPWCFAQCSKLAHLTLQVDGQLEMIDDWAFASTALVGAIVIPVKVKEIQERAFWQTHITSITFGHGPDRDDSELEWLGSGSLSETKIEKITIPGKCKNVGEWTFLGTSTLKEVTFAGGLNQPARNIGIRWLKGTQVSSLVIPTSSTAVKDCAFEDLKDLKNITITQDVKIDIIGFRAFANTKVTALRFGNDLREIEPEAFEGCGELTTVELPGESKLRRLKHHLFHDCVKLKKLVLPGIEGFDSAPFDGCAALRVIKFTLLNQGKALRTRVISLPDTGLFPETARVFIAYPEGTLKDARNRLKDHPGDFE
jgi:hypothetical protein